MKKRGNITALIVALVLACGVIGLEWYSHVGRNGPLAPVQAVTAPPSAGVAQTTATPPPVVYVPTQATPMPSVQPSGAGTPQSPVPTGQTPAPLNAGETPLPQAPVATLAPTTIMPPVLRAPPDAPPRILAMSLSTPVARSGDVVSGTVETSSNVASVEARIGGYGAPLHKVGVGRFSLAYRVPPLPFFLHRTYTIQIIARNTRGQAATSSLPITLR